MNSKPSVSEKPLTSAPKTRIVAIDALRGLAHVVMALEHAAPFVGIGLLAETYLGQRWPLGTWPNWLSGLSTHMAAPIFWLVGGCSIALFEASRRKDNVSQWAITRFFLIRAALIILLDLTVCSWVWADTEGNVHVLLCIAIGIALLSVARLLPQRWLMGLSVLLILGYQAALYFAAPAFTYDMKHNSGVLLSVLIFPNYAAFPAIEFPILGWVGLMGIGYVIGRNLSSPWFRQPKRLVGLGVALLSLWLVLRWVGGFGDFGPSRTGLPWNYFLAMSKAPPSLTYLAFFLGLATLAMAGLSAAEKWLTHPVPQAMITFGQTSLFFFTVHIPVYRLVGAVIHWLKPPLPTLVQLYIAWFIGLVLMVPLTRTYRKLKRRYPKSFLQYL